MQNTFMKISGTRCAMYKLMGIVINKRLGPDLTHYTALIRSLVDPTIWFYADDATVSVIIIQCRK